MSNRARDIVRAFAKDGPLVTRTPSDYWMCLTCGEMGYLLPPSAKYASDTENHALTCSWAQAKLWVERKEKAETIER